MRKQRDSHQKWPLLDDLKKRVVELEKARANDLKLSAIVNSGMRTVAFAGDAETPAKTTFAQWSLLLWINVFRPAVSVALGVTAAVWLVTVLKL